jgi:hypothetical protein
LTLLGKDINLDRSQGDIGLFVPDAGYPFGEIPDWLIQQRARRASSRAGGAAATPPLSRVRERGRG